MRQAEGLGTAKRRLLRIHLDLASNLFVGKKLVRLFTTGSTLSAVLPVDVSHVTFSHPFSAHSGLEA
jgi:hypothetical protein